MSELALASSDQKRHGHWLFYPGLVFLALALAAIAFELWSAIHGGGYRMIAAGELWFKVHGPSLNLSQAIVQRYVHPVIWDPVIITLLKWPAWSIFGGIGAFLTILFGPWLRARG